MNTGTHADLADCADGTQLMGRHILLSRRLWARTLVDYADVREEAMHSSLQVGMVRLRRIGGDAPRRSAIKEGRRLHKQDSAEIQKR